MPSPEAAGQWFAPVRIEHGGEMFVVKPHAEVAEPAAGVDGDPGFVLCWALFPHPWEPGLPPLATHGPATEIPRERAAEAARAWLRTHHPAGTRARRPART